MHLSNVYLRLLFVVLGNVSLFSIGFCQQSIEQTNTINGLELGEKLETLENTLYLITGKESIYQQNQWLAESVTRNLEKGIQEGIYEGSTYRILNGRSSTNLRLHFYHKNLYKIRWTFDRKDFSNLPMFFSDFKEYFSKRYGPPSDFLFGDTYIWESKNRRLQLFIENDAIQVEFRDEGVEKKIKSL
jgi:hypothetical protein